MGQRPLDLPAAHLDPAVTVVTSPWLNVHFSADAAEVDAVTAVLVTAVLVTAVLASAGGVREGH
jgi:hypothetical protein